jgi:hypothetical protein
VCIDSLCRNIHSNYSGVAFELVTAILSGCVIYLNGTSTDPKALRNLQFLNALGEGKKKRLARGCSSNDLTMAVNLFSSFVNRIIVAIYRVLPFKKDGNCSTKNSSGSAA